MSLSEIWAHKLALLINEYAQKDDEYVQTLEYGLAMTFISITKAIVLFILAYFLGLFKETILFLICFVFMRKSVGGIHAQKSNNCTIATSIIIVGGAYVSINIYLNKWIVGILFLISLILIYLYAPADTKKNPITDEKCRKLLKKRSIIKTLVLVCIVFFIKENTYVNIISLSTFVASVMITPYIYIKFGKEYGNYEKIRK
ncbi:accessory gene regulator B family protein [Clostridium oceanicum]|uniref:AgrB-like protein n=1 Tax=Clostridium oceanicum TaxID=1543 RepID=A0ABN1J8T9_9CLOT